MTTPNIIMTRIDERLIHGQGQVMGEISRLQYSYRGK